MEDKLLDETIKPFVPSGHAFVTFDSSVAADACVKKFQIGPMEYLKYFYQQVKEKICGCFSRSRNGTRRSRTLSTFIKFEDLDDEELKTKYEEAVLEVRKATEPNDILWKNMKGDRGHFICRRMLIYLACLVLIIFVSTPIFIFANMKKADSQHFFDLGWADYIYGGSFLKSNFPPLCVIMINIALLYLIDIVAYLEF